MGQDTTHSYNQANNGRRWNREKTPPFNETTEKLMGGPKPAMPFTQSQTQEIPQKDPITPFLSSVLRRASNE